MGANRPRFLSKRQKQQLQYDTRVITSERILSLKAHTISKTAFTCTYQHMISRSYKYGTGSIKGMLKTAANLRVVSNLELSSFPTVFEIEPSINLPLLYICVYLDIHPPLLLLYVKIILRSSALIFVLPSSNALLDQTPQ